MHISYQSFISNVFFRDRCAMYRVITISYRDSGVAKATVTLSVHCQGVLLLLFKIS